MFSLQYDRWLSGKIGLYGPFVAGFLALATLLFWAQPGLLVSLRYLAFDTYQRLAPAPPIADSAVRVVAVDERSLALLGQWPWPRATIAELTQALHEAGAAAIVFDILFAEPDRTSPEQMLEWLPPQRASALRRVIAQWPTHDSTFAESLGQSRSVLAAVLHDEPSGRPFPLKAGMALAGDDPSPFLPSFSSYSGSLPAFAEAASGVGFINWLPDRDQVLRRVPLLARQGETIVPSLALEALRVAQGASTYIVRSSNAHGTTAFGAQTGVNRVRVGDMFVPTDAGSDIWIHFRRAAPSNYIAAGDVLRGAVDRAEIEGRIVLVGATAPALMDLRATPLDAAIPGVEVHQQVLEQIVYGRPLVRPDFAPALEWLTAMLAVLLLAVSGPRASAAVSAMLGLAVVAVVCAAGMLLFAYAGVLLDPVFPAACAFVFAAGSASYFYRRAELQRAEIRRAFSQYVAPSIVRELTQHPERLKLGGEVRDLTVMVCDIRNFTAISEGLSAEQLTAFINSFLSPLTDLIIENGGTIDKYMGDSIMAFWNAPTEDPEHARHGCAAALLMMEKMRSLNAQWRAEAEAEGRPFTDVAIGIGLNSGECCVGNLGSDRHFDYSAIGDTVNVTQRLEELTKLYSLPLLAGEQTAKRVGELPFIEVDLVRLRGRKTPTRIFTLLPNQAASAEHGRFLAVYRAALWGEARALLADLRATAPASLTKLYETYAARLERLAGAGVEKWDGIYETGPS